MSKHFLVAVVFGSMFLGYGCSSGDVASATPGTKLPDAPQKQGGKGGVKAAAGGGVMPAPEDPKPGEHVGPPPSGAKSGGGG